MYITNCRELVGYGLDFDGAGLLLLRGGLDRVVVRT